MSKTLSEEEYQKLFDHYNENKDLVMKEIESDARVMAWIAWGINELFPEKSPKEMLDYMKDPNLEELGRRIIVEPTEIKNFSDRGYILDSLVTIRDEEHKPRAFIDVENQIDYDKNEIGPRSLTYLCSVQFKLGNAYKTGKFSDMLNSIGVWILPDTSLENVIEHTIYEGIYTCDDAQLPNFKKDQFKNNVNKLNTYFFFLGEPKKINFDKANELPEDVLKTRILLFLFDSLFNLELDSQYKLELLKLFHLTGIKIERIVELMDTIMKSVDIITERRLGYPISQARKNEAAIRKYQADLENKDAELKNKDSQIETIIKNLYQNGSSIEQIMKVTNMSKEQVMKFLETET